MAKNKSSDNTTAVACLLVIVSVILGVAFYALMQRYDEARLVQKQIETDEAFVELQQMGNTQSDK